MKDDAENLIKIGKITGTHGIKGELKFFPYSGSCDSLSTASPVLLELPSGKRHTVSIQRIRSNGTRHTLLFSGFDSINQVEQFVTGEICLYRSQLPKTDDNEYYWCDLIGLRVTTNNGTVLGTVTDIFSTGSNDVYVVNDETREYLIPAIADVIVSIDLDNRVLTIAPLDGLLEL